MQNKDTGIGLAVSRAFFFEWGLPKLTGEFPDLVDRLAVGRLHGSDVLEADDIISRDHNWGPQFSLFLTGIDYDNCGLELSERMNIAAPNSWQGHRLAGAGDKAVQAVAQYLLPLLNDSQELSAHIEDSFWNP